MSIDYVALKAEMTNDPTGLGFAADTHGDDQFRADLLNAVRATIDISRTVIPSYEIINATVMSEWTALSAANKQLYQTLTGAGEVDASNPNVRTAFTTMFAAGATRTALAALQTRKGSRAEQLFGQNVSANDIAIARRS